MTNTKIPFHITHPGGIGRSFKTACKNAGIPFGRKIENGITIHDIRRTTKTNMLEAGIEKEYRDLILGHSLKGMDGHYIKPKPKVLKKALKKYTQWIEKQYEQQLGNAPQTAPQIDSK